MEIRVKRLSEEAFLPKKMHEGDAGYDLSVPRDTVLRRGRRVIDLEFAIELPRGYAATI